MQGARTPVYRYTDDPLALIHQSDGDEIEEEGWTYEWMQRWNNVSWKARYAAICITLLILLHAMLPASWTSINEATNSNASYQSVDTFMKRLHQPKILPHPAPLNPDIESARKVELLTKVNTQTDTAKKSIPSDSSSPSQPTKPDTPTVCDQPCDFKWGNPSLPSSTEQSFRSRGDLKADLSNVSPHRRPQDLYSWSCEVIQTGQGPGVLVRIRLRDCCSPSEISPLTYFRVTAHGRSQAAIPPPFALGPMPHKDGMGRGNQDPNGNSDAKDLRSAESFLLLPDAGQYSIQVSLTHWNVSEEMVWKTLKSRPEAEKEQGVWVAGLVTGEDERVEKKIVIPIAAPSSNPSSLSNTHLLPLCGSPQAEQASFLAHSKRVSPQDNLPVLSMSGRWALQPFGAEAKDNQFPGGLTLMEIESLDLADRPRRWLVERSRWRPYHCRLDYGDEDGDIGTAARASHTSQQQFHSSIFSHLQWIHLSGDSNGKALMLRGLCEGAGGRIVHPPNEVVAASWDPPFFCVPSASIEGGQKEPSKDSIPPKVTDPDWFLSFDRWHSHSGKANRLKQSPNFNWSFRTQCDMWPQTYIPKQQLHGWWGCSQITGNVTSLRGPHASLFSFGSHGFVMGDSSQTAKTLSDDGPDGLGLLYFATHPTLVMTTTAIDPSLIPEKFGRQQTILNNERILGLNKRLIHLRRDAHHHAMSAHTIRDTDWLLILDTFSATYAVYEHTAKDAVHFIEFIYKEWTKWILHFLRHAPNFKTTEI